MSFLITILSSTPAWDEIPINRNLIVAMVLIGLLGLKEVFNLMPALLDIFSHTKASMWLEYNKSAVRRRDIVAMLCIVPFCMLVDRFELYCPIFWIIIPPEWRVVASLAVFIIYIGMREIFGLLLALFSRDHLSKSIVRNGIKNYFILLCIVSLISAGVLTGLRLDDVVVRICLYVEITCIYLMFLIRSVEILKATSSSFATILYLCGMEILPATVLVGSAVFL